MQRLKNATLSSLSRLTRLAFAQACMSDVTNMKFPGDQIRQVHFNAAGNALHNDSCQRGVCEGARRCCMKSRLHDCGIMF